MSVWVQTRDQAPGELRSNPRPLSVTIVLALVCAVACGFSIAPALAQQTQVWNGNPTNIGGTQPETVDETLDRVRMRGGLNPVPAAQKSVEKDDTCLLPPLSLVHSPTVATTNSKIPAKARKEYQDACTALKNKKTENVEKHLRKAVQEYPQYSAAWVTLGQVLAAQQQLKEARSACSQGSTADSSYVPAYLCLADLAAREKAWDEVLKLSGRALELDPATNAVAYEYNAAANLRIHKLADAEKSALRALEIDKNHSDPRVYFVLAQIYEAKGDPVNEAAQLREYLKFVTNPEDAAMLKQSLSTLEKQTGK